MPRTGRPKKPLDQVKTKRVVVFLTEEEWKRVILRAHVLTVKPSALGRDVLLRECP